MKIKTKAINSWERRRRGGRIDISKIETATKGGNVINP